VKTTIIALFTAVQIAAAPAVLARDVSTKTPDKHHKMRHHVATNKGQPRTQSAPQPMAEPEKPMLTNGY